MTNNFNLVFNNFFLLTFFCPFFPKTSFQLIFSPKLDYMLLQEKGKLTDSSAHRTNGMNWGISGKIIAFLFLFIEQYSLS